jgi:hypothetical protein
VIAAIIAFLIPRTPPAWEPGASHARPLIERVDRERLAIVRSCSPGGRMTVLRHHVHHVHSGWPSPYVGFVAAALFGVAVLGVFSMLLWLTR